MSDKTLLIIDSHALIYRAYYAFPPTLTTSSGEPINAVFGYTSLLLDVINKFHPTNVIAVLDSGEPIERQLEFTQYKTNRDPADEVMINQLPRIEEVLREMGVPIYKINGIEADDIIATIDHEFAKDFSKTIIVTGDQDLFQLVDQDTFVYLAGRKFSESKLFNTEDVLSKIGVTPEQIPDYKSIAGDKSDNIPGVRGVGPKGAVELIKKYGSLEDVYKNIDEIKGKLQEKLVEGQEIAYISKKLATSNKNVPLSIKIDDSDFETINIERVREVFNSLQFKSLIPKLERLAKHYGEKKVSYQLFSDEEVEPKSFKVWSGEEIPSDEISIFFTLENKDADPLGISLKELYFSSDDIYFVEQTKYKEFFENIKSKTVIGFDIKKLLHAVKNLEIEIDNKFFDLGVCGVIASGARSQNTMNSVFHFVGEEYPSDNMTNLAKLSRIKLALVKILQENELLKEVFEIESNVTRVVYEMERTGISIDNDFFEKTRNSFETKRDLIIKAIYDNAGHEFNINSPKQVGDVLFVEKSLPIMKKTKGGSLSTDERTLRNLIGVDPIVENILRFREIDKILNTYIKSLPSYINKTSGRIHATFDQLGAISGRFSSKNPNLQNIPKGEVLGVDIRDGFVAAKGSTFISFDYSQQELRILAALSGESIMIDSFNIDSDIHRITASEIFNVEIDEVTPEMREKGKTINFSIVYGISSFGLSDRMKISREESTLFIKRYFERYPSVKDYMDKVLSKARSQGYLETVMGRRRYSPTINSNNRNLRSAAEREMFNFIIQGSAADIMKKCMESFLDIEKRYPVKLLLQIHDEFLFEYKGSDASEEIDRFIKEVMSVMTSVIDIGVKYKVEASIGDIWGEMKKY